MTGMTARSKRDGVGGFVVVLSGAFSTDEKRLMIVLEI